MDHTVSSKIILPFSGRTKRNVNEVTNLANAQVNKEYVIKEVKTDDEELKNFLFTLGCYEGETVTVLSVVSDNLVISVKDARYSIDKDLAEAIIV
ncbi:MAG: ferrous iron transport protein A [Clostridium sp.]|nr:ferrous iron transport protein A [Clostridium sp.]